MNALPKKDQQPRRPRRLTQDCDQQPKRRRTRAQVRAELAALRHELEQLQEQEDNQEPEDSGSLLTDLALLPFALAGLFVVFLIGFAIGMSLWG